MQITFSNDFPTHYWTLPLNKDARTVLCKSNASEVREFRSLFPRTFARKAVQKLAQNFATFQPLFRWNKERFIQELSLPQQHFQLLH